MFADTAGLASAKLDLADLEHRVLRLGRRRRAEQHAVAHEEKAGHPRRRALRGAVAHRFTRDMTAGEDRTFERAMTPR
jgi:hypothetical protein